MINDPYLISMAKIVDIQALISIQGHFMEIITLSQDLVKRKRKQ